MKVIKDLSYIFLGGKEREVLCFRKTKLGTCFLNDCYDDYLSFAVKDKYMWRII